MSQPARYVYATLRAFAGDETSGGRSRTVILGNDGSEISWDGDRIRVVEPNASRPVPPPRPDRIATYVETMMSGAAA